MSFLDSETSGGHTENSRHCARFSAISCRAFRMERSRAVRRRDHRDISGCGLGMPEPCRLADLVWSLYH